MEFDYIVINLDELFAYLKKQTQYPIIETDILRHFFPRYREVMYNGLNLDTYKMHFIMYHYLHKLSRKLIEEKSNYIIHIKYIYIYLLEKPKDGLCQYFNTELETFCKEIVTIEDPSGRYCKFHYKNELDKIDKLDFIDISNYYLNFDNYYKMDEEGLEKTLNGIYKYIQSKDLIEQSLDTLSLSIDTPFERIKERFKYLSKKYHPDRNKGISNDDRFKKISSAYQVLKEYYGR